MTSCEAVPRCSALRLSCCRVNLYFSFAEISATKPPFWTKPPREIALPIDMRFDEAHVSPVIQWFLLTDTRSFDSRTRPDFCSFTAAEIAFKIALPRATKRQGLAQQVSIATPSFRVEQAGSGGRDLSQLRGGFSVHALDPHRCHRDEWWPQW